MRGPGGGGEVRSGSGTTLPGEAVYEGPEESERIFVALDDIREQHKLHERTLPNLFDAAIGLRLRNASYRSNAKRFDGGGGISNQVATSDLGTLVELGLLEKHGAKRGTYYVGASQLKEIVAEVRKGRKPIDAGELFSV